MMSNVTENRFDQKMIVDTAAEIADQEGVNGVSLAALSKK